MAFSSSFCLLLRWTNLTHQRITPPMTPNAVKSSPSEIRVAALMITSMLSPPLRHPLWVYDLANPRKWLPVPFSFRNTDISYTAGLSQPRSEARPSRQTSLSKGLPRSRLPSFFHPEGTLFSQRGARCTKPGAARAMGQPGRNCAAGPPAAVPSYAAETDLCRRNPTHSGRIGCCGRFAGESLPLHAAV